MLSLLGFFGFGTAALIISLVAMREKKRNQIIAGWILVGIVGLIILINWRFAIFLIERFNVLLLLVFGALTFMPVFFLIRANENNSDNYISDKHDALDSGSPQGQTTEEYLDDIINSPDEEIDYEEDLDLR